MIAVLYKANIKIMNSGPIVIIEDDLDDQEIIADILKEIDVPNESIFFSNSSDAWTYLKTTSQQPFIILCDINLPKTNGLEFKKQLDDDSELRKKSVPFVFFSTAASEPIVKEAYTKMTIQGFFQKGYNVKDIKHLLVVILEYWKLCRHPNSKFS